MMRRLFGASERDDEAPFWISLKPADARQRMVDPFRRMIEDRLVLGPDRLGPRLLLAFLPAPLQQLAAVEAARRGALAIVGDRMIAARQQANRQPIVDAQLVSDDPAAADDGDPGAVQRPVERIEAQPFDAASDCLVPGFGEAF